jgi:hypothetical protein
VTLRQRLANQQTRNNIKWIAKGLLLMGGWILFVMLFNWLVWGKFSYGN